MDSLELLYLLIGILVGIMLTLAYYMSRTKLLNRLYVGVGRDSYGWYWRIEAYAKRFKSQKEALRDLAYYGIHNYTEE